MLRLTALLLLLAPAALPAQLLPFVVDSPGPVRFDAPGPVIIAAYGDAMTGPRTAVDAPGTRYVALLGATLRIALVTDAREILPEPFRLREGDHVHACAYAVIGAEPVAVAADCGCLLPSAPRFAGVEWTTSDAAVLRMDDGPGLCDPAHP